MFPQGIKYYDIPTHPQSQRLKDIAVSSTSWSMEKQETPATSSSGFLKLVRSWYDLFSHPFRRMAMNYDPFCDSLKRGQSSFATKSWDARRPWGRVHPSKKKNALMIDLIYPVREWCFDFSSFYVTSRDDILDILPHPQSYWFRIITLKWSLCPIGRSHPWCVQACFMLDFSYSAR